METRTNIGVQHGKPRHVQQCVLPHPRPMVASGGLPWQLHLVSTVIQMGSDQFVNYRENSWPKIHKEFQTWNTKNCIKAMRKLDINFLLEEVMTIIKYIICFNIRLVLRGHL